LLLFGIAGGACSLARDFNTLLAFRFLQGIGAASLGSLTITIIGDLYSERYRAKAMGYNASICSIGTAIAPIIGGALAALAWFVPFAISVIAVPVGIIALFSLKNPEPKKHQDFKQHLSNVYLGIKNAYKSCFCHLSHTIAYYPFRAQCMVISNSNGNLWHCRGHVQTKYSNPLSWIRTY